MEYGIVYACGINIHGSHQARPSSYLLATFASGHLAVPSEDEFAVDAFQAASFGGAEGATRCVQRTFHMLPAHDDLLARFLLGSSVGCCGLRVVCGALLGLSLASSCALDCIELGRNNGWRRHRYFPGLLFGSRVEELNE